MSLEFFFLMRMALFMVEILVGEFLFFNHFEKRSKYYLRGLISFFSLIGISLLFGYFQYLLLTSITFNNDLVVYWVYSILPFLILIVLSGVGFYFVYSVDINELFFSIVCGYCLRHLVFSVYLFIINICLQDYNLFLYEEFNILKLVIYLVIYGVFYASSYVFFSKKLKSERNYDFPLSTKIVYVIIIIVNVSVNATSERYSQDHIQLYMGGIILQIFSMIFVLFIQVLLLDRQSLRYEKKIVDNMLEQSNKQYKFSQANQELIRIQAHDLKHKVAILRKGGEDAEKLLNELESITGTYNQMIQTDNNAIDTVIFEKIMYCNSHDIKLSYMVSKNSLDFMDNVDIYALVSNLIDNAIEATSKLEDKNKKVISLNIGNKVNLTNISITNYYLGNISFKDGLPITSKDDKLSHGFGMKSIKKIVEKYQGTINIEAEDNIFALTITFTNSIKKS